MIKNKIAKIAGLTVGMTLVLGGASTAGAETIAELQVQINALMAQLASLQGGTVANPTACTFTRSLTLGASGADVTCLQNYLTGTGHFTFSGGSTGYFGSITRSAVASWQAANGVAPAVGYFGPISQARYTVVAGSTTVTIPPGTTTSTVSGCTAGAAFSSTTGQSCVVSGGITTPGVEGTITVEVNSTPTGVKLREGDSMKAVAGIEIEAKTSDMRIERVKLDLDATATGNTDQQFYNKIATKVYVLDGSTVLASVDLNTSTVVEDGTDRFITISGFNFVIPKDTIKVLTIALDARSSWDSTFDGDTWTVGVPVDGVRSVDGAGVNQYGPGTAFTRSFTSEGELVDDAEITVSKNVNSPKVSEVIASDGTDEDELDNLELLRFNVKAEDDNVEITDLVVTIVRAGSGLATTSTLYLVDGSTVVGSETATGISKTGGDVTFDDIDYVIPEDTTKTFKILTDIDDANGTTVDYSVDIQSADFTTENSIGDVAQVSGSATGDVITVRNIGLEITLLSKSIVKSATTEQDNVSTSTAEGTFNLRVTAVGGDILLGTVASTTGAFVANHGNDVSATGPSFIIYQNGVDVTATLVPNASSTNFTIPTSGTTASGTNTRLLAESASVDFPVSFLFQGREASSALLDIGSYAIGLEQINWVSSSGLQASTFMADELDWRTTTVSMP